MRFLSAALTVLSAVGFVVPLPPPAPASAPAVPDWAGPLSTRGRYLVDANGNRFKLKAASWHGASGTWTGSGDAGDPANHHAGEIAHQTPLGLDRASIDTVVDGLAQLGLNSVRLPFSNAMVHDTRPVPDLAANPGLHGLTPLQVYDRVVERLTARGFAVVLNNHTTTSRWCCGLDGNERWNTAQAEQQWQDDWLFMARRYARTSGSSAPTSTTRSAAPPSTTPTGAGATAPTGSGRASRSPTASSPTPTVTC